MEFKEYKPSSNWDKKTNITERDALFEDYINFHVNNNLRSGNRYVDPYIEERVNSESTQEYANNPWLAAQEARSKYWNKIIPSMGEPKKWSTNTPSDVTQTASKIIDHFVRNGYTREQAAGIAGNLMQESSFNTKVLGDSGKSYGLAQWNSDRLKNLRNFSLSRNTDPSDFSTQLDFILHELETTEGKAKEKLLNTKTVEEAAEAFSRWYERPGTPHLERRLNYALQFYNS